jgi:hypothetical protein
MSALTTYQPWDWRVEIGGSACPGVQLMALRVRGAATVLELRYIFTDLAAARELADSCQPGLDIVVSASAGSHHYELLARVAARPAVASFVVDVDEAWPLAVLTVALTDVCESGELWFAPGRPGP